MGQQPPQLEMRLDPVPALPPAEVAEGYRLRVYREGDAAAWCRLVRDCIGGDCTEQSLRETILGARAFAAEDLLFAAHGEEVVGTAWALRKASLPAEVGYVHMVGVDPAHRGRGLGRALLIGVLRRFREVACRAAILHTDDFRLPALRLYRALNFAPVLSHPSHAGRWREVEAELAGPREGAS